MTSRTPRASLCITLLTDEDYRLLMSTKRGAEAFGIFVSMIVAGRERLQQGQARQLSNTESLAFDNSTTHLLALTHVTKAQLDRCLRALSDVSKVTGVDPWMYLDESKHLVIRSFFKFNARGDWGGARPGAGRNSRRNQDDSTWNQDEKSRFPSDSLSLSDSIPDSIPLSDSLSAECAGEPRGEDSSPPKEINSEAEARRAVDAAEELFPLSNVRTVCRQWLRDHKADRVIRAMATAQAAGAAAPTKYVQRILDSPETQHPARASPPPAESEEERRAGIERNTRLMVERLAERDAEKKARQASGRR